MKGPVAVIAAHPDDEVLGCGGTIARLAQEGRPIHILFLADGESSRFSKEEQSEETERKKADRDSGALWAGKILGAASVQGLDMPDNRLDELALLDVVRPIESFIARYQPQTIFTHHSGDVNVDHRIVHDAVITASRPQPGFPVSELLFFEVPSSTEWRPPGSSTMFNPNWYVDISQTLELKIQALRAYESEIRDFPHPRSTEATMALAKWRGATVGIAAAEAFILGRKCVR